MLIGIDCFEDMEIRSMIASEKKVGKCEIIGADDVLTYNTEEDEYLQDYFSDILDVYTPVSGLPADFPQNYLSTLADALSDNWSIFAVKSVDILRIIKAVCKNIYPEDSDIFTQNVGIKELCDSSFLRKQCLMKEFSWEQFKSSIKNINRFHSNHVNLDLLEELFESESMHAEYKAGELMLYRGRISDEKGFSIREMGPPPIQSATAGRANSAGITCLYLTSDIDTTFHEIRARDFDYISVGEFLLKKDINEYSGSKWTAVRP